MIKAKVIDGEGFDPKNFDAATWTKGVSFKQYADYPAISTALTSGEVSAFCVDKSILPSTIPMTVPSSRKNLLPRITAWPPRRVPA